MFLNVDAGELQSEPEELYGLAHVVNIACGGHAGDDASMRRVIACCNKLGVRAGAHPSYPDREGFGRLAMTMSADALEAAVAEQCHALASIARSEGDARVGSVKLHGALYHAANADAAIARAALEGAVEALGWEITVIGPPDGATRDTARELGLAFAREGFADRNVRGGKLVPRGEPDAMIDDPARAAARVRELLASGEVDTVCVHGDGKHALVIARAVRAVLG
jgi:5-oxoprolinase (ATP-hydrolysing) subunit A